MFVVVDKVVNYVHVFVYDNGTKYFRALLLKFVDVLVSFLIGSG